MTFTDVAWDLVTVTEYDSPAAAVAQTVTTTTNPMAAAPTQQSQEPAAAPTTTSEAAAAPVTTSPEAEAVTVAVAAPTTTTPAAETSVTPTTTSQQAAAASATSGEYSGDGTFYELGLTACGQTYTDSDYVAAISYLVFDQDGTANPNGKNSRSTDHRAYADLNLDNPHCGKKITVYRDGKSVDVTIVDRCAGCENMHSVDLSPIAFDVLGNPAEGRIPITWSYT